MPLRLATSLPKDNLAPYSHQESFPRGLPLLKSGHVQTHYTSSLQPSFDMARAVIEGSRRTHHYDNPPCIRTNSTPAKIYARCLEKISPRPYKLRHLIRIVRSSKTCSVPVTFLSRPNVRSTVCPKRHPQGWRLFATS
jgi:hypothetical protein